MKTDIDVAREWDLSWTKGWNRFWFAPNDPATLSLIRLLAGAMLLYTHLVWSLDLWAFFGPDGWLPRQMMQQQLFADRPFQWSYFWWIDSSAVLWTVHIAGLIVFALLMIGYQSRVVSVLAFLAAVSYAHRITPGAYFGLDQVNCMLALYLMLGPCGARFSVDAWLAKRRNALHEVAASASANFAARMIQVHLCIVYAFSAFAKMQGQAWWDGTAVWWAVANPEYQSLDMTWLANWPLLVSLLTYSTLLWELAYPALIWPAKTTRPIMLAIAVAVHGGIALCMGMITFGVAMIIANLAFVPPQMVRTAMGRITSLRTSK